MTLEMKAGVVYLALLVLLAVFASGRAVIRKAVNGPLLQAEHAFYVSATGQEPVCATCPMNKHCPYYGQGRCKFATQSKDFVRIIQS